MTIDRLEQVVYMESKGSLDPFPEDIPEEERPFDHNLTHCSRSHIRGPGRPPHPRVGAVSPHHPRHQR